MADTAQAAKKASKSGGVLDRVSDAGKSSRVEINSLKKNAWGAMDNTLSNAGEVADSVEELGGIGKGGMGQES